MKIVECGFWECQLYRSMWFWSPAKEPYQGVFVDRYMSAGGTCTWRYWLANVSELLDDVVSFGEFEVQGHCLCKDVLFKWHSWKFRAVAILVLTWPTETIDVGCENQAVAQKNICSKITWHFFFEIAELCSLWNILFWIVEWHCSEKIFGPKGGGETVAQAIWRWLNRFWKSHGLYWRGPWC